jgi:hypothetical protein
VFQFAQHVVVDVAIRAHAQKRIPLSLGDVAANLSMFDQIAVGFLVCLVRPRLYVL